MYKLIYIVSAALFFNACSALKKNNRMMKPDEKSLTAKEKKDGWQLLFNGATTAGWHTYGRQTIGKAWKAEDGGLHFDAALKKEQPAEGGDIVTDEEFENFDLKLDWKVAPKGNSGIMFFVKEDTVKYPYPWYTGPEMQLLDNAGHPDAKITKHRAGDLYDLISVSKETVRPAGAWNTSQIVAYNGELNFYLNGEHVISTTLWDDNWRKLVAGSKFKDMPDFGTFKKGKIALQDHGDEVWFRNIKIRRL